MFEPGLIGRVCIAAPMSAFLPGSRRPRTSARHATSPHKPHHWPHWKAPGLTFAGTRA